MAQNTHTHPSRFATDADIRAFALEIASSNYAAYAAAGGTSDELGDVITAARRIEAFIKNDK